MLIMVKFLSGKALGYPFVGSIFSKDLFPNFLAWLSHGFY
jgi:hypothetical protein